MIELDNRYQVHDGKYEYKKIPLTRLEGKYVYVPLSIILDTKLDAKRVAVFSYLRTYCCLNDSIVFSIPDMVKWCASKPSRNANGSNDKYFDMLNALIEKGYFKYLTKPSKNSYMKCEFNKEYYDDDRTQNGYAVLYLDEIDKILKHKCSVTNTTVLLVFAYLRNRIIRRPNELNVEERYPERVKDRRERCPEAYDDNVNNMAKDIGISLKTLLKVIDILECELKLIVTDRAYRVKNDDDEFRTPPTIFANAYKREREYLLDVGDGYSRDEIQTKAKKMKKYIKGYKINESKRR